MSATDSSLSSQGQKIDREIMRGMGIVLAFATFGALIGAGKEVVIAWQFGVGDVVDAYQFVFNLSQWPLAIFASVFTVTLVPLVARLRSQSPAQLPHFRAAVFGIAQWLAWPLAALVFLSLFWTVRSPWIGLNASTQAAALDMLLPMALAMGAGLMAVVASGWILAFNRHTNTLMQAVPALVVLLAVLLIGGGGQTLAWSTAFGFFLYAVCARWYVARVLQPQDAAVGDEGQRAAAPWSGRYTSPHWRPLLAGMGTLVLGQVLISFVTMIDQFFAARLGVGALSTLGYANRIVALVLSIASIAISRGMLPVLSRVSVDDPASARRIALRFGAAVALIGAAVGCLGAAVAAPAVALLFERGQFTPADTQAVATLVRFSMLQVPFYLASMVVVSALLAQGRFRTVLQAAAINSAVKILLALALVESLGMPGLFLATAAVYLVSTVYCGAHVLFGRPQANG